MTTILATQRENKNKNKRKRMYKTKQINSSDGEDQFDNWWTEEGAYEDNKPDNSYKFE